jgi:chromosome partitioning protein
MNRTLVFTNRKGGVGKTTTTVNVAAALAHIGHTVLVIDADPQSHATMSLGIHRNKIRYDLSDVAFGRIEPMSALQQSYIPRLRILPATRRLADFERRHADDAEARFWFQEALDPIKPQFDFICFDTPPTTQLLTMGALIASDEAYVPLQTHFLAVEGLVEITELIELVRSRFQPGLALAGIIPTFFEQQSETGKKIVRELEEQFGAGGVLRPIRVSRDLAEAPAEFDYYILAQQILRR